jgi:hypothetical protein
LAGQEPIEWFFRKGDDPLFSHAEVLEFGTAEGGAPLKHDTLQNWANRGYVVPTIEGGKRRYTPAEVAIIVFAQHLVNEFGVEPGRATKAIYYALLILRDKIGFADKPSLPKKIPAADAKYQIAVYLENPEDQPSLYDARRAALEIFNKGRAFIVLPIGRLLNALASRMRRQARPERRGA